MSYTFYTHNSTVHEHYLLDVGHGGGGDLLGGPARVMALCGGCDPRVCVWGGGGVS